MIYLKREDYGGIITHAVKDLPNEACGLLGGTIDENGDRHVEKVYYLKNLDDSKEHFSMDPKEQFAAIRDMRNHNWTMLGNWHSHPESPSRPSKEDQRLAFDSAIRYLILSLTQIEKPVLNAFILAEDNVAEEQIQII